MGGDSRMAVGDRPFLPPPSLLPSGSGDIFYVHEQACMRQAGNRAQAWAWWYGRLSQPPPLQAILLLLPNATTFGQQHMTPLIEWCWAYSI